jgi:D-alanine-D-alanine ligase
MKVAIIYNKDLSGVINRFGMQNKETYNPATINRVADALENGGHNVAVIDGSMGVIQYLQEFMPRVIQGERMGMVFNMAYGIQGESRYTHIPSMLEMLGIPYIGSSPAGHTLALDKVTTKILIQKHGLPTPDFWVISRPDEDMSAVEFPAIVKPKMEAVSFGLKVVYNLQELKEAVSFIIEEFQQAALVEVFIRGREFAVGLLGNNPPEAFPVLEIDLENDPDAIQTVENKRTTPRGKICPADLPDDIADDIVRISIAAFNALQLRDFARVDLRMDKDNNLYILEINSMASMGPTGSYVHAAGIAGYDFKMLVNKMLDAGVVRYFADHPLSGVQPSTDKKASIPVKIRTYLRNSQENIENLLHQLVNINSHVRNVKGVNTIGNLIIKYLAPIGFKMQEIPQVEVGNILYFSNSVIPEVDILLLSHLDNNTTLSEHVYFQESEQKLMGSSIWSFKGGLAMMVAALQALRYARAIKKVKIGILLTSDDSLQGKFAQPHVRQFSRHAKYVLGLCGSSLDGSAVTSRSGAAVYACNMNLIKADKAEDVAWAMSFFSNVIGSLTNLTDTARGLVVSPWKAEMKSNITDHFAHGEVRLSVRFNDPAQVAAIDKKIKKIIPKKYRKVLDFQFEGGIRRPPMERSRKVEELWQVVRDIAVKLDIRLLEEHRWGSADICFIDEDMPILDGLGPAGEKISGKAEFILRHSLLERAALLAMAILELPGRDI